MQYRWANWDSFEGWEVRKKMYTKYQTIIEMYSIYFDKLNNISLAKPGGRGGGRSQDLKSLKSTVHFVLKDLQVKKMFRQTKKNTGKNNVI